jgi:hypothetical protein
MKTMKTPGIILDISDGIRSRQPLNAILQQYTYANLLDCSTISVLVSFTVFLIIFSTIPSIFFYSLHLFSLHPFFLLPLLCFLV